MMVIQDNSFTHERRNSEADIRNEKSKEERKMPKGDKLKEWPEVMMVVSASQGHLDSKSEEKERKNKSGREATARGLWFLKAHGISGVRNEAKI